VAPLFLSIKRHVAAHLSALGQVSLFALHAAFVDDCASFFALTSTHFLLFSGGRANFCRH
jgi:hypothetical protein